MQNTKKNNIYKYQIKGLEVFGFHGINEDEINKGQVFIIDIDYSVKYSNDQINSDNIIQIVDYTDVVNEVNRLFKVKRYNLLELLLKDLHDNLQKIFNFNSLNIYLSKKDNTYYKNVKHIGVEMINE